MIRMLKKKEPQIRISEYHYFQQTNAAVEMAMELFRVGGFNLPKKKPKSLSYAEEASILDHPLYQLNNPRGIIVEDALVLCFSVHYQRQQRMLQIGVSRLCSR
jgi:hypothetical protein